MHISAIENYAATPHAALFTSRVIRIIAARRCHGYRSAFTHRRRDGAAYTLSASFDIDITDSFLIGLAYCCRTMAQPGLGFLGPYRQRTATFTFSKLRPTDVSQAAFSRACTTKPILSPHNARPSLLPRWHHIIIKVS
jgi:hypothetical protein